MAKCPSHTPEELRKLLRYDSETGIIVWLKTVSNRAPAGSEAGGISKSGYRTLYFGGENYFSHRIAWAIAHGRWPVGDIDHINGDRLDNSLRNLREVDRSTNLENMRKPRRDNNSGYLGVCRHGSNWRAQITIKGKRHVLGSFTSPHAAHCAYLKAKRSLHAGCTI